MVEEEKKGWQKFDRTRLIMTGWRVSPRDRGGTNFVDKWKIIGGHERT